MIAWFARNGVAANLLMLAVMGFGAWTLVSERIPIEVFPDMPSRFISVNVPYPGATPEEVEETIVLRIEDAIQQVAGTVPQEMRSKSVEGVVTLIFIVDETGRVVNPRVEKASHPAFEAPALEALRQWKFEPAVKSGKRVSCRMRVPMRFQPR
jgi:TonB family protein